MNRERLKGNLDLLLLSVLAAGPAHGYQVIAALRQAGVTAHITMGGHYPSFDYAEVLERIPELDSIVRFFADLGVGLVFFFAGYEIDPHVVRGEPLRLAAVG